MPVAICPDGQHASSPGESDSRTGARAKHGIGFGLVVHGQEITCPRSVV